MKFLVACAEDMRTQGLRPGDFDAIIVTGDAYVDHPSFGVAIIGRVLEAAGYQVAILSRPDPDEVEAFRIFGKPRLCFWSLLERSIPWSHPIPQTRSRARATILHPVGTNRCVCGQMEALAKGNWKEGMQGQIVLRSSMQTNVEQRTKAYQ